MVHEVKQHLRSRCRLKRTTSRMLIPSSIGLDAMRPTGKNLNSDQGQLASKFKYLLQTSYEYEYIIYTLIYKIKCKTIYNSLISSNLLRFPPFP